MKRFTWCCGLLCIYRRFLLTTAHVRRVIIRFEKGKKKLFLFFLLLIFLLEFSSSSSRLASDVRSKCCQSGAFQSRGLRSARVTSFIRVAASSQRHRFSSFSFVFLFVFFFFSLFFLGPRQASSINPIHQSNPSQKVERFLSHSTDAFDDN